MTEWLKKADPDLSAIIDADHGMTLSYGDLSRQVDACADCLRDSGASLVFVVEGHALQTILHYLACLQCAVPVCLLQQGKALPELVRNYQPSHVVLGAGGDASPWAEGYDLECSEPVACYRRQTACAAKPHPRLALLLSTSGSTGNQKLVRLSRESITANADAIAEYLELTSQDRSIQSLPLHYSYGLSLINSHFAASGSVVLTSHSFMSREFWDAVSKQECTGFAGVPSMYEFLAKLRMGPHQVPSIRYFTQAGGKLAESLQEQFLRFAVESEKQFFVMYGQTEATARIAYVPPHHLGQNIGSIGQAIPGGTLGCRTVDGLDADVFELVYEGPNVMMGYAESVEDLSLDDELQGTLYTGDLVKKAEDGSLRIVGRLKRFAKVFGLRINLADIENHVSALTNARCAACEADAGIRIYLEAATDEKDLRADLSAWTGLPPASFAVRVVEAFPYTGSGKIDYPSLRLL